MQQRRKAVRSRPDDRAMPSLAKSSEGESEIAERREIIQDYINSLRAIAARLLSRMH